MWKIQLLLYPQARKLDSHPKPTQDQRSNKREKVTISKNLGVWLLPPEADWQQSPETYSILKDNSKQIQNLAFKNLWLIIGIIFVAPNPAPAVSKLWKLCQRKQSLQTPVTEKTTQGKISQGTKPGALKDNKQGIYFESRIRGGHRSNWGITPPLHGRKSPQFLPRRIW